MKYIIWFDMVYNNIIQYSSMCGESQVHALYFAGRPRPSRVFFDEFSTMIYCNHQQLYLIKILAIINHIT